jgi:hypothetical protein
VSVCVKESERESERERERVIERVREREREKAIGKYSICLPVPRCAAARSDL